MVNKLILNRIQPILDPLLRNNQNGFRPGRSTTTQILALRRIIEGLKARNLPAVVTFIDFTKAFDTVDCGKMLHILRLYGIPSRIVDAIGRIYENTKANVLSPDGETEFFNIKAGVLQGDTLSPYLFIIVLDYILRQSIDLNVNCGLTIKPQQSRRIKAIVMTDLDFADDLALLSDSLEKAQKLLHDVEAASVEVGLVLNAKKN